MTEDFSNAFTASDDEWLNALESGREREQLKTLIGADTDSAVSAAQTLILEAYPPQHRGMKDSRGRGGAVPDGNSIFKRLKTEFDKFVCGHQDYADSRKTVADALKKGRSTMVSALAGILASALTTTAALLAPAIVALLIAFGRIGQKAYCAGAIN
jgi:hypothetical protein